MENENTGRKSNGIYWLAGAYVFFAYTFWLWSFLFMTIGAEGPGLWGDAAAVRNVAVLLTSVLPFVLGIVNLIVLCVAGKRYTRAQLLNCTVLIKYGLIPLYLFGALAIAFSMFLSLVPVPFMIFVGPAMMLSLGATGYMILLGAAPFSITYLIKARREGVHGKVLTVAAGIMQFFFTLDVISLMMLAVKEKRWVKLTVTVLALLLLLALLAVLTVAVMIAIAVVT